MDTHTLVWLTTGGERLSATARDHLADASRTLLVSPATVWELSIKNGMGKLDLKIPLPDLVQRALAHPRIILLPITPRHALGVRDLPQHHRDPFDRLLIATALAEGCPIVSKDTSLDAYEGLQRIW